MSGPMPLPKVIVVDSGHQEWKVLHYGRSKNGCRLQEVRLANVVKVISCVVVNNFISESAACLILNEVRDSLNENMDKIVDVESVDSPTGKKAKHVSTTLPSSWRTRPGLL